MKKVLLLAGVIFAICLTACATTEAKALNDTPKTAEAVTAVSETAIAEATGLSSEEVDVYMNFSSAEIKGWSLDAGKKYVTENDRWMKIQDQSGNENTKYASLAQAGDDKVLSIDFGLAKRAADYTLLFNYSEQGAKAKNLTGAVIKASVYIPACMIADGNSEYPSFKFFVRDNTWNMTGIGGDINSVDLKSVGSGWQTLTIDFKANTFEFGNVKGKISPSASALKNSFSFDIEFISKKLTAEQNAETILFDYIDFEGMN